MKTSIEVNRDHVSRAYNAMKRWGDEDRDDDILEGACEASYLTRPEIAECAVFLAALERFCKSRIQAEFLPALLAEGVHGRENLAAEYGTTIPANASLRRATRKEAVRSLAA